jgi:hypothetical protein
MSKKHPAPASPADPVSEKPDSAATEPETAADADEPQAETLADEDGADAAAPAEGAAEEHAPSGDDGDGLAEPAADAGDDAEGSRADGAADGPAPALEDEDQSAPAAVDLDKAIPALRDMAANRYGLYRRVVAGGYSSDPGGKGLVHDQVDVDALIAAGLARHEPSGGMGGSVKITPAGRDQLALAG